MTEMGFRFRAKLHPHRGPAPARLRECCGTSTGCPECCAIHLPDVTPSRAFKDMSREELAAYKAEQAELDAIGAPF